MPRLRCPVCGSTKTIKIEKEDRSEDKTVKMGRGRHAFIMINPSRVCTRCGQRFRGEYTPAFSDLVSIDFSVGGYFGPNYRVVVKSIEGNKYIFYARSSYGLPHDFNQRMSLDDGQWDAVARELTRMEIPCWKKDYFDHDILDGIQWDLSLRFSSGLKLKKFGSNAFPVYWDKFLQLLHKYTGRDFY